MHININIGGCDWFFIPIIFYCFHRMMEYLSSGVLATGSEVLFTENTEAVS